MFVNQGGCCTVVDIPKGSMICAMAHICISFLSCAVSARIVVPHLKT